MGNLDTRRTLVVGWTRLVGYGTSYEYDVQSYYEVPGIYSLLPYIISSVYYTTVLYIQVVHGNVGSDAG